MKNRRQLLFVVLLLALSFCSINTHAQDSSMLKFPILDAYVDNRDVTPLYRNSSAFFALYFVGEQMYMSIALPKLDSQSYGPMINQRHKHTNATMYSPDQDDYDFDWHFKNTYDDNKGVVKCHLHISTYPNKIVYDLYYHGDGVGDARFSGSAYK